MFRKLSILFISICLCSRSLPLPAQQASALKDVVSDQYVERIEEDKLNDIEKNAKLSGLDQYSHFLSEEELVDISSNNSSQSFVLALNSEVLYLRIPIFHVKTSAQVHRALMTALQKGKFKAVIIDLRGNRGGLLNAAIEVSDEFVKNGMLASTKGRQDNSNLVFVAKPGGLAEQLQVAVLIDKTSASAAELLAGILRVKLGAPLIGQNSFGKSAVQSQISLASGSQLKLTTAYYYFSDNTTVSKTGLVPNVLVSTWQLWRYPPFTISNTQDSASRLNPLMIKSIDTLQKQ